MFQARPLPRLPCQEENRLLLRLPAYRLVNRKGLLCLRVNREGILSLPET